MKNNYLLFTAIMMLFSTAGHAAQNAYAKLTLGGTALTGDTSVNEIGGMDVSTEFIEIYQIDQSMTSPAKGKLESTPMVLKKRIDKASPFLLFALDQRLSVAGDIMFFDNDPATGEVRVRYIIRLTDAAIVGIQPELPDTLSPQSFSQPLTEYIQIEVHGYDVKDGVTGEQTQVDF